MPSETTAVDRPSFPNFTDEICRYPYFQVWDFNCVCAMLVVVGHSIQATYILALKKSISGGTTN